MATVGRRKGRSGWYVKYTDATTGKRVRRHVPSESKAEARRIGFELERRAERQAMGLEPRASDPSMTLAELARWWLQHHCPKRSLEVARPRLERHVCGKPLGATKLSAVTPELLTELLASQTSRDGSPSKASTINRTRSDLRSAFKHAQKARLWVGPKNPLEDVERHRETRPDYQLLRAEEVPIVLAAVAAHDAEQVRRYQRAKLKGKSANPPAEWRDFFAAAFWTGLRKGELCGLQKADVDLREGFITVRRSYDHETTKSGKTAVLPIAAPLAPYLKAAVASSPSAWVFPDAHGAMRTKECDPQEVLHAAMRAAGARNPADPSTRRALGGEKSDEAAEIARGLLNGWEHICRRCKALSAKLEAQCLPALVHTTPQPDSDERHCANIIDGKRCASRLWPRPLARDVRFHDVRHTAATLMMRAGVDLHRVQRVLRHSSPNVTAGIYAHLTAEDLRSAVNALPAGPVLEPAALAVGAPAFFAEGPKRGPITEQRTARGGGSENFPAALAAYRVGPSGFEPLTPTVSTRSEASPGIPAAPAGAQGSEVSRGRAAGLSRRFPAIPVAPTARGAQMGAQESAPSLSVREVAAELQLSIAEVCALIERGELEARVDRAALDHFRRGVGNQ